MRPPIGTIILLLLAALLYAATMGNLVDTPGNDAAGRGMAQAFAAIFGVALWLVLAILLVVAIVKGQPPVWAVAIAVVLLPVTAVGVAMASGRGGWIEIAAALPPLLVAYLLWLRVPRWHRPAIGLGLAGVTLLLALVPVALALQAARPDPVREARLEAERKARQDEEERQAKAQREADAARFAKLGPDSSLKDYLDYAQSGAHAAEARRAMRLVKSRQADAAALLQAGRILDLPDLLELDVDATPELCQAYGAALSGAATAVDKRVRSDYLTAAIELERQLPNIEWLVGERCDLVAPLGRLEANVRAVSDSSRMTKFADTLAKLARR